jgi:hypothetical protein
LTGATVHFTFDFLAQNQANTSPASFSDTLSPGQTKVYENVVETKLGLSNALGAARVTADGEVLVSERIYNQSPGDDLGKTEGLFFAGVPKSFSISLGQSASIQGIDQGGSEDFRYNFALVETAGHSATVHVVLSDADGNSLGSKDYMLQPYEQVQPNVDDVAANLATTNARITATVTAGAGSALLAGAQLANQSQDSSGFEMSFRDDLLGGGGGGGLSAVSHDGTLVGNGTGGTPLGINPAAVVTSLNGLHGGVALSAGSNVTITPSGNTLTIAASGGGGGGGLTLPFSGAITSGNSAFSIENDGSSGNSHAVAGIAVGGSGVVGTSSSNHGILGEANGNSGSFAGVAGLAFNGAMGVYGSSSQAYGVRGDSNGFSSAGVYGNCLSTGGCHGVQGRSIGTGVGNSAIYAQSDTTGGIALFATNNGSDATVVATNASSGPIYKGFANGGTLVFQVASTGAQVTNNASSSPAIAVENDDSTGDVFWGIDGGHHIRFIITAGGDAIAHGSFAPNGIDYADRLPSAAGLEPGDVVAIGPEGILQKSNRANDTAVAGVYSTKPGVVGRRESERRPTVPVALAGVIPVNVTAENGAISAGDLLVSSSTPGRAMKAPPSPAPGTVIGKAMQPLGSEVGTIEMLVMLR